MTDHLDSLEEPNAHELAMLARFLAPADLWDDPPAGLEGTVVAAIAAESAIAATAAPPRSIMEHRLQGAGGRRTMPWWLAAAAISAIVVAGIAFANRGGGSTDGTVFALSGTDAAPGASAGVRLSSTPAGLKILLDADGLPGAPDGFYYEAWVSDGTTRVSAGTFHLRGGNNEIELWAGVVEPAFDTLTVTLEPIDGDADSSGDVRLRGRYDLVDG